MPDSRAELQQALGNAYTIERELGGGGMSRVFLAEEAALGRKVVVKVLPEGMTGEVSLERFRREIQVSAKLQHPHIVPVLTTGEVDGVPYYTMPFVDGESLRARLIRMGPLPMTETVGFLRDVAKALAYAHDHGVAHRDIKPDNILVSGGSATVADFGIAKAISAARGETPGGTLTQVGTSIGTPAYMAPEQAAADPSTDHRADIYAFGCVAFELLAGRPPFVEKTPQRLLAAQMGTRPQSVSELRPDTPAALADLVMRCLEKDADARPQQAVDLVRTLEVVTSGAGHPAVSPILLGGPRMFRRALALYSAAFVVVLLLTRAAVIVIGLPDWVVPGMTVVMLMGLPVVLATGYVQRVAHRALTMTPTYTPGGSPSMASGTMATMAMKASPHLSWRRTATGGMWALAVFVVLVGGFMTMRALGIGPAGSLFASGRLGPDERLLVAEFGVMGGADSSLGAVVAEAIRADLGQSNVVTVVPASVIRSALQRMRRPENTHLDATVASEIALREGVKAVVQGDVTPIGAGFILTARLVDPASGDLLASFRSTADAPTELIPAVERLSRAMRGKIGESLRDVRASVDLADVTTGSLDALRKYAEGTHAVDVERDAPRGIALLKEAIALDSAFAMAWRKLGVAYSVGAYGRAMEDSALARAYAFRERLPEVERLNITGLYYGWGPGRDRAKAAEAFEALSRISGTGYHNLAVQYSNRREYARAESLYRRNLARNPIFQSHDQLIGVVAAQGKWAEAESLARAIPEAFPGVPGSELYLVPFVYRRDRLDSVALITRQLRANQSERVRADGAAIESHLALIRGQLRGAEQAYAVANALNRARGVAVSPLADSVGAAWIDAWFRGDGARAARRLDAALRAIPLRSLPLEQRPYFEAAKVYALAGRSDRARAVLAEYEADVRDTTRRRADAHLVQGVLGEIALAERRPLDALRDFRRADTLPDGPAPTTCHACVHVQLARAFDHAEQSDSAIASFERYLAADAGDGVWFVEADPTHVAGTHKRLGELYEQRGDAAKAIQHFERFVALWKDADAELQPRVEEVRRRIARLRSVEGQPR
jgi:tetratricopeptide (TPR) repeat protein